MFRSKKDIDRHVQDLEDKFRDHTERFLKYNTVAKLYFNFGEVDLALKYLDKFLEVRGTSTHAFKFSWPDFREEFRKIFRSRSFAF